MVRNYLIVVGIVWLILHGVFSWGMPDAWLGIAVLSLCVVFALLNCEDDVVAGASFVPLASMSLLGAADETAMRVFFRCFSEGEAHGLATLLTTAFSIMLFPSLLCLFRIMKGVHGKFLVCSVAVVSFAGGSWMFDCDVVILDILSMMLLSTLIGNVRGLAGVVACGLMMALMGECSRLTSKYLVVKCMASRCQGWIYATWVLCMCAAHVFLWRRSMKGGQVDGTRNLGSCELAGQGAVRGIHDKD